MADYKEYISFKHKRVYIVYELCNIHNDKA
jgi:hypothetical protein